VSSSLHRETPAESAGPGKGAEGRTERKVGGKERKKAI